MNPSVSTLKSANKFKAIFLSASRQEDELNAKHNVLMEALFCCGEGDMIAYVSVQTTKGKSFDPRC